jgi:hypothetical protein
MSSSQHRILMLARFSKCFKTSTFLFENPNLEELKTKPQHLFSIAQASQLIPLNLSAPNDLSSITSRKKESFFHCFKQIDFFELQPMDAPSCLS